MKAKLLWLVEAAWVFFSTSVFIGVHLVVWCFSFLAVIEGYKWLWVNAKRMVAFVFGQ